ncbi:MAG: TolC family protein, partial [Planctomycetota bacterium]
IDPAPDPTIVRKESSAAPGEPNGDATNSEASTPDWYERDEVTFTLEEAVNFGLRNRPSLQVAAQQIAKSRAGEAIAFSPYLPQVLGTYRMVGGVTDVQGFTTATLPTVVGFGPGADNFTLAEMHVQWTLWDFGKTRGRYDQSLGTTAIAELQYQRAKQTTELDVRLAYYHLLFAEASVQVGEESVRRAKSHLYVARNMLDQGAADLDDVLRAEVQLAEMEQKLVSAKTQARVGRSALNLAMGRNASEPLRVVPIEGEPGFGLSLEECLQMAIDARREFIIIQQAIRVARSGERAIKGEFLPRLSVAGTAASIEGEGVANSEVLIAGINFDVGLYEGGRKIGELQQAKADVRASIARAKQVCDNIAFEVNHAFFGIDDARQRIVLARTAVRQSLENLRLVENKFTQGAATPTDVVDAETTLTRAQQSMVQAVCDYHSSIARLVYAVGVDMPNDLELDEQASHPTGGESVELVEEEVDFDARRQAMNIPKASATMTELSNSPIRQSIAPWLEKEVAP